MTSISSKYAEKIMAVVVAKGVETPEQLTRASVAVSKKVDYWFVTANALWALEPTDPAEIKLRNEAVVKYHAWLKVSAELAVLAFTK